MKLWDLPNSWEWANFGDVATVESNLVDPADHKDLPHVAPNHIESGTGRLLPFTTVANDGVTSAKHLFRPGHIIYSKIRPYLAKAVLVDFEGVCSADCYPVGTALESSFLHRWLISSTFAEAASRSQGRTVLPKINQKALAKLQVPVAPPNEQKRIVAKLDALQARSRRAREALDAIPALLDRFRQSVLAAAFRGDLTADWRAKHPDVEPASVLLERIRAERKVRWIAAEAEKARARAQKRAEKKGQAWGPEQDAKALETGRKKAEKKYTEPEPVDPEAEGLPELPKGWCWARSESVTDAPIGYGIVQPGGDTPGGVPYVRGTDVQGDAILVDQLLRTTPEISRSYDRTVLRSGDVILCIIRHLKVALVPPELEGGNLSRTTALFRPGPMLSSDFLAWAVRSPLCQQWLKGQYRAGTTMPKVNIAEARQLPIPIAPIREQAAVVEAINNAMNGASPDVRSLQSWMDTLDQAILAKAFRGELVPQNPSDEPASVLLERLREEREASAPKKKRRRNR